MSHKTWFPLKKTRYIGNFIPVHRVRPEDDESDGDVCNPEDLLSDEELFVDKTMLGDVLQTRIGGKKYCVYQIDEGDAHHMNSSAAISLGTDIWKP